MDSPRSSRPPTGFARVSSMSSSETSSQHGRSSLVRSSTLRSSTMSTLSAGSVEWASEASKSQFQNQLQEMAVEAGVPLAPLPSLLSLPEQRVAPVNASDKAGAEDFLMSLRPKRVIGGKSKKGFVKDEVLVGLAQAVETKKSAPIVEAILQLATNAVASAGGSANSFTSDKRGRAVPTIDYIFGQADLSSSPDIWRLFLGRVSETALNASLAGALKDRPNDINRLKSLLEYGANPELCQDRILDLIATGVEPSVGILLLSPRLNNVELLSHGLVKAARCNSLRNICMLLARGASANFNQAEALKAAVLGQSYEAVLAMVTMTKSPISSSNLDEAAGLIASWTMDMQKPFLVTLLYAGASGPRTSKILIPFITAHDQEVIRNLIECPVFRHSTFPAPRLFQFAVDTKDYSLALEVLRSSNNRSFSDYASTGAHLQLVNHYSSDPEESLKIISELLTFGGFAGDYASQMLVGCCRAEQIESPRIMTLVSLLISSAGAKVSYSDGAALFLAIEAANVEVVSALTAAKPTKKILSSAITHTSLSLRDENSAKLELWSILLDAGASGTPVDQELVTAIDQSPNSLHKVKVLLKGASLDFSEGKAIVNAVQLERMDLLEAMLSQKAPQYLTMKSVWKHIRKLFALPSSKEGDLPYRLPYMQKVCEILYNAAKGAAPVDELLLDATQCSSKEVSLNLARIFLRWGASPDYAAGSPLEACIKRSDTKTLAALMTGKTSKSSLKFAFNEALSLRGDTRHVMLEILIGAGLEKGSLDAALPTVLKEERYDEPTVRLLVEAGARLNSSFGENLVPPSVNLDIPVVEKLLATIVDKDSILLPLKSVIKSHTDWKIPDGQSLPMVKLLIGNCNKGTWADMSFVSQIKSGNQHSARIFAGHLTSDAVYSDALKELFANDVTNLDREKLSMTQYLLDHGAKGKVIDTVFVHAAKALDYEWVGTLYPYLSDRSVASSAFDLVTSGKGASSKLQGKRLAIVQFLLKQGLEGPLVNDAFVKAASTADLKGMNDFLASISSKETFSESLELLAQQEDLLTSREGLAAVEILISNGASDVAVAKAAKAAAKIRSLEGVKLTIGMSPKPTVMHAAFQGFMDQTEPLGSFSSRAILLYLLENGLKDEDTLQVARLAASTFDIDILKALTHLENASKLLESAIVSIALAGGAWLSPKGLQFVGYLLGRGISSPAVNKLVQIASEALHRPALELLLPTYLDQLQAAEMAFGYVVSDNRRWTSVEGLRVVGFILELGVKGTAVQEAAAYAAKTSNHDALDMFLKSPAAATVIPAAFKALTRNKPGQMSSDQLTIASTLIKQGVSTEVLAIAAIEMAKLLDLEGLKVLSQSSRFDEVTDDVLRAILLSEELWRVSDGLRITRFILEKGVSTRMVETAASKAAASLDIDALRNIIELNSSQTIVESAFTSMTSLEKAWLCQEGRRIAELLLQYEISQASINTAFIQASQYLQFDAVQLLHPHITELSVFGEALHKAVSSNSGWLSALHIIQLLLDSGVEGDAVEYALIEGARALNYESVDLLATRVDRPEAYTKALEAATQDAQKWRNNLAIIEFLLHHGASGEPVEKAYVSASQDLDLSALHLLNPCVANPDTHSQAFRAATSSGSWLSPKNLDVLEFLYVDGLDLKFVENALVSAAKALNIAAVELLAQNADQNMCTKAFTAATACDAETWTSPEGTTVVNILAQKGVTGESVDEAFIVSSKLSRLDLVTVLADSIHKDNYRCISRAFDALLAMDGIDLSIPDETWMSDPDALNILNILVNMGANGQSAHEALVRAAQCGNSIAVDTLSQVVHDPQTYAVAFNALTTSGTLWLQSNYLELVAFLLSHGAAGQTIDSALTNALPYVIEGEVSQELVELLLGHNADVNFDRGKPLQLAASNARQDLFEMLLINGDPDSLSLFMGLKAALESGLEEETVFGLFKSITANESLSIMPDVNYHSEDDFPLIFYCLNNYPDSARLAKEICDLNADLSALIAWDTEEDEYEDAISDFLPPLSIALLKDCSDEVVQVLLDHGANINFIPQQARATALMLAAGKGRSSIVSILVDKGASIFHKDAQGRTPLSYAARCGDISSLKSILKKNPPRNDGSLHDAARGLHSDAVRLLIKTNHDVHFPSSRHQGRSPLCELCYACRGFRDPVGLQNTLNELHRAKAEPLRKCRGRTAFFMAMENANPSPVLTALIEAFWKDLNDPDNVYEEGDYFYSPTMYIIKGIIKQPEATAKILLDKLQDFSATDMYYAKERMQQPEDAKGMPQRIRDYDHKKWMVTSRREEEDEDHKRKLRMEEQELENRRLLSQRQHMMLLEQREDMTHQKAVHALDTHLLTMKLRDREHTLGLAHQDEKYDHRLGEMTTANHTKLNIEAAQYATKFGMQQQTREAQLEYNGRAQEQKIGYLDIEQGVRYSGLEAQQNLRLEGMSSEAEILRQKQYDEIQFRESRSGVERADLDHKLQFANQINTGKVQTNRDLGDIQFTTGQRKLLLENKSRQSQQQHQMTTDEQRINTQTALNQQEYALNQNKLDTRRAQGQIDISTRADLSAIEQETMFDKFHMTQQDRGHKLETEQVMGQIQYQNLQGKFELTQQDRNNQLQTEHTMGQIKNQSLQQRQGLQYNHLINTQNAKLGYQQATDQQKLGYQQEADYQQLSALENTGRIENSNLNTQQNLKLGYQYQSGNMKLGFQAQGNRLTEQAGNVRLQQKFVGNRMDMQKGQFMHQNKMVEMAGQSQLNAERVRGTMFSEQAKVMGNRARQFDSVRAKQLKDG